MPVYLVFAGSQKKLLQFGLHSPNLSALLLVKVSATCAKEFFLVVFHTVKIFAQLNLQLLENFHVWIRLSADQ